MKRNIVIVHLYMFISALSILLTPWFPNALNYSLFSSVFYGFLYAVSTEIAVFKAVSIVWIVCFTLWMVAGYICSIRKKMVDPFLYVCAMDVLASAWAVVFKLQIDNWFGFRHLVVGTILRIVYTLLILRRHHQK